MARFFLIVARDQSGLYEYLKRAFSGDGEVDVLLDRRQRLQAHIPERRADSRWQPGVAGSRGCHWVAIVQRGRAQSHGPDAPTADKGGPSMTTFAPREERDRVMRWIEEGQKALGVLLNTFVDYDRLQSLVDSSEQECQRLRAENEQLQAQFDGAQDERERLLEEVHRLRIENERYAREREELTESLNKFLHEVVLKLRVKSATTKF